MLAECTLVFGGVTTTLEEDKLDAQHAAAYLARLGYHLECLGRRLFVKFNDTRNFTHDIHDAVEFAARRDEHEYPTLIINYIDDWAKDQQTRRSICGL